MILGPAVQLALRAPQPREAYTCAKPPWLEPPLSWFRALASGCIPSLLEPELGVLRPDSCSFVGGYAGGSAPPNCCSIHFSMPTMSGEFVSRD